MPPTCRGWIPSSRTSRAARRAVTSSAFSATAGSTASMENCSNASAGAPDRRKLMIRSFNTMAGLFLAAGGCLLELSPAGAIADNPPSPRPVAHRLLLPLRAEGNEILDSNYQAVLLRGVNCPGLEWTSDGQNHMLQTVSNAIQ